MEKQFRVSERQLAFLKADADEVLFGGAAGGGKSFGQMIDAFVYAMKHPGSRQLVLRRSMPELERTLIRTAELLYPARLYDYKSSARLGQFRGGSTLEFGYLGGEGDLARYQSAEYDVIRFDELTHFGENEYRYLRSRLRGANRFPKQLKSTTNPGGPGHAWVKARFIDPMPPGRKTAFPDGSRVFLPARAEENVFLMKRDPDYLKRLESLSERDRRALLLGDWALGDGRFFPEFCRDIHVAAAFPLPEDWPRFLALDYGLDRLAALWFAEAPDGQIWCYRELCESGLLISEAAARVCEAGPEEVAAAFAPRDLWNRRQDTGRSAADRFAEGGVPLTRVHAPRETGWLALKELLRPVGGEDGKTGARLRFFDCCREAIRCISDIAADSRDPNDAALFPHGLTHACDAARYFALGYTQAEGEQNSGDAQLFELLGYGI